VVAGRFVRYLKVEDKVDLLSTMNLFYSINWPNRMIIHSTWLFDLRTSNDLGVWFTVYYGCKKSDFDR
jgi:hypothetical protein